MPAPRVRWEYDRLSQLEGMFLSFAEILGDTRADLARRKEALQGGDWVGEGADAFYREMDDQVLPAYDRLVKAMSEGARTMRTIHQLARNTEDEAAHLLSRLPKASDLLGMLSQGAGAGSGAASGGKPDESGGSGAGSAAGAAAGSAGAAAGADQRARALANPSTAFDTIGSSAISESEAPASIKIPSALSSGMQGAWKDSFPGGKSQEQGGLLVKKADGTYEWRRGKTAGTSGTFTWDYGDVKSGETLIASAHTHPYDKSEGSHTNVPFSGQDMARLVYVKDPISVVQSGDGQFALARTKEFDSAISGLDATKKRAYFDAMKSDWNATYRSAKGSVPARADAATKAVATKYHLVYYHGKNDTLSR